LVNIAAASECHSRGHRYVVDTRIGAGVSFLARYEPRSSFARLSNGLEAFV
jgi:hypothetical protein